MRGNGKVVERERKLLRRIRKGEKLKTRREELELLSEYGRMEE